MTTPIASHVDELEALIKARYPYIWIVTHEERRVEESIKAIAVRRDMPLGVWSFTEGLRPVEGTVQGIKAQDAPDPGKALDVIMSLEPPKSGAGSQGMIFVLRDYHPFIADARVTRKLRDLVPRLGRRCVIFVGPVLKVPVELEKDIAVLDWTYPDRSEMAVVLDRSIKSMPGSCDPGLAATPEGRDRIVDAVMGLTRTEAENVLAKSIVARRTYDVGVIMGEKKHIIRKSGILEYYEAEESMDAVGGMTGLKGWLGKRRAAFGAAARAFGLPVPKGMLLVGVPGCGKSLTAKAVASTWGMPLLRLDVGKVMGGLVGASEENIRKALKTAEAAAPCILWLDEIEKGFSGTGSSDRSDGGTTARVFGTFVTWMQEKTAPVFVIATANNVQALPPEMLRKGRFDELFFVDLPSTDERADILKIHLAKKGLDVAGLDTVVARTADFSGSELEAVVVDAMYDAFDEDPAKPRVTVEHLLDACSRVVPLATTMAQQIAASRDWARTRARPAGAAHAPAGTEPEGRSLLA